VRGVDVTTEVTGLVRTLRFQSGTRSSRQVLVELNADAEIAQQHALEPQRNCLPPSTSVTRRSTRRRRSARHSWMPMQPISRTGVRRRQRSGAGSQEDLRAPFAGRLALRRSTGAVSQYGDKVVTLQALDPIYVDFKLPQQQLATSPAARR